MFVETSTDMNQIAKEDREWSNTYHTTLERYDAAARAREEELWQAQPRCPLTPPPPGGDSLLGCVCWQEQKMFVVGLCGTFAILILSGVFNIGIGYFLIVTGGLGLNQG